MSFFWNSFVSLRFVHPFDSGSLHERLGIGKKAADARCVAGGASSSSADRPMDAIIKETFKRGSVSAQLASEEIRAAHKLAEGEGGATTKENLGKWAKAGGGGTNPKNMHRDLLAQMRDKTKSPLYCEQIPFYDKKSDDQVMRDCYFSLPHEEINARAEAESAYSVCHLDETDPIYIVRKEWCMKENRTRRCLQYCRSWDLGRLSRHDGN